MNPKFRLVGLVIAIPVIILFMTWLSPFVTIGPGHRGVVTHLGKVQDAVLGEGFHFRVPIYETVIKVDVQVQKEQQTVNASSKDLQFVETTVALNYNIVPESANWILQNLGTEYRARVIDPQINETVKAITARYNATELISERERVRNEILEAITRTLAQYRLHVVDFAIVNFAFSPQFTQAIEAKQTAEQNALKAQRDLERIKVEAEQKITQAKAEAEALNLQKQAVTPELIELRRIEMQTEAIRKWDGHMPQVTGSTVPFIGVGSVQNDLPSTTKNR